MKELIEKLDSSLLKVQTVMNYLNQFPKFLILQEEINKGNGEISILAEEEVIRIIFLNIKYAKKWWSIYRYHKDGIKYEQIDAIIYDDITEKNYNQLIKYSYHIEDDTYSYITCSCFSYLNDKMVQSWKQTRVVPIED